MFYHLITIKIDISDINYILHFSSKFIDLHQLCILEGQVHYI